LGELAKLSAETHHTRKAGARSQRRSKKMAAAAKPQVHIESVQTGLPTRLVEPDRTRLIAVSAPPLPEAALQRRLRAVLYYRADEAAWEEGIWVKCFFPEMAGRLRRRADGSWEVKLNDAGVRFQQATVEATLDEFLVDKDRVRKEAALAPWIDVSAEDPDMCSLLFMQVYPHHTPWAWLLLICSKISAISYIISAWPYYSLVLLCCANVLLKLHTSLMEVFGNLVLKISQLPLMVRSNNPFIAV
jgi:hypothetical protein